jgi:hypothetical protein
MKKQIAALLSMVLLGGTVLTACSGSESENPVKTGFAVITTASKSASAGEKEGLAQIESTFAAVTVDKNGKITNCVIDTVQTKVNFDATGKITTDLSKTFDSKKELGDAYDMKKASSIGKEWYEQAAALEKYIVGKTIDEVKGIAVSEGKPTDPGLKSSVTMSISGYLDVVAKAVENAKDLGAKEGDKLGIAQFTSIDKSADAGEKEGKVQAYSYYAAVTVDKDGKVTSAALDASQSEVKFTTEGAITTDFNSEVYKTKQELGAAYNMKGSSGIGKEWNEQADAFAKYITGKSLADIKGIALEGGKPSSSDLTSSVTITVAPFVTIVEKAINSAK